MLKQFEVNAKYVIIILTTPVRELSSELLKKRLKFIYALIFVENISPNFRKKTEIQKHFL
jgi:hypothetical protein